MTKPLTKIFILLLLSGFFYYLFSVIVLPVKSYTIDPRLETVQFFVPTKTDVNGLSIREVKKQLQNNGKQVTLVMNGGMYNPLFQPVGLTIINGKIIQSIVTKTSGFGNFFLQPNGIFLITNTGDAKIVTTQDFAQENIDEINYATQSGPLLVTDNKINELFTIGSENREIRNGVCVLENGQMVFAISRHPINFYDFASFFKDKGCINALYLDGSISKAYIPSQFFNTDGNVGMVITSVKK